MLFIYFVESEEGRETETERNIDVPEKHSSVASETPPHGDLVHKPGM